MLRRIMALPLLSLLLLAGCASAPVPFVHHSTDETDAVRRREREEPEVHFTPNLSDLAYSLEPAGAEAPPAPAFITDPAAAYGGLAEAVAPQAVEGAHYYDLSRTPYRTYWWKMPLYAVAGFPRDLIDAVFGAIGFVPVLNVPITGAYEYSGAQYLVRHRDDVHAYGGEPNASGHGWTDGQSWGWFSHFNQTTFREVDQERLRAMRGHNERLESVLQQKKNQAEFRNLDASMRATEFLEETLALWDGGQDELALGRLYHLCRARPSDYEAAAYYIACLMHQLDRLPAHRQWLAHEIRRAAADYPASHYFVLSEVLAERVAVHPRRLSPRLLLVWTYARMGSSHDALAQAEAMAALPHATAREHGILAEALLMRLCELDPAADAAQYQALLEQLRIAVVRMKQGRPDALSTRLASARHDIMRGQYAAGLAALEALAEENPAAGTCPYYLGLGLLRQGMLTDQYERARAVRALRQARRLMPGSERLRHIQAALEAAGRIR